MILNNFIPWMGSNKSFTSLAGTNVSQGGMGGNVTSTSNNVNAYYTTGMAGSYVDVGFGNTPVTKNDYKLANSNAIDTPTLTFLSNGYLVNDTYPYIRNLTTTYANNTLNDVTITEIGYVQKTNSADMANLNVLLTRTVLDTPIVVPAGKQVAITISLEV